MDARRQLSGDPPDPHAHRVLGRGRHFRAGVDHRPNGPLVPVDAHIRLAAPATNGGQKILRRGYHFTDGADPLTGQIDAGLFFLAYQKDVRKQFIPIQKRLSGSDALNEYIRHTSSGIFAVPPGLRGPGDWYGQALFS